MCGICGMIGEAPAGALEAMVSAMGHRGPDDSGIHREGRVSLGMTRLAVIDLSAMARQPMRNPEGSVWIVYNGETYNFREEREILEGKGHSFASASDTEVVLRMYEQYGDDFLLRMRGMFALAIYDRRRGAGKEKVLLARDPLGIKPLLYAGTKSGFVFASEMKAILASGLIDGGIDPVSLRLLLVHGSVTQPATVLRGVRMLLPGHRMVLERGSLREEPYWRIAPGRVPGLREAPYPEIVERAREALAESVRLQMVSDVPVGAFLSGGLDSSLLVSLMASLGGGRVRTFSVGFEAEGAHIDETDDAYRIAKFLETDHTRVPVTGKEVAEFLPRIASALDQPSVDGVNSFFVSRAASGGVKVAVSGTGGDELFAGYPWFAEMAASDAWDREH
ncbi:MAG TPA: asparagine synthase (glutamine-hydrolyzing), partial [Candidatus Deferrimicrobiaceae bacterium]